MKIIPSKLFHFAILSAVALATSHAATTLSGTGLSDNAAISSSYGSNLPGTPNIALTWTPSGSSDASFEGWQAYASWTAMSPINTTGSGVYQMGNGVLDTNYDILFTPDAGYAVVLNTVDINIYSGGNTLAEWQLTARIMDSSGTNELASYLLEPAVGNTLFDLENYTGANGQALLLRFNINTVGRGGGYIAMDNLVFDQIPEPSGAILTAIAFAGLGIKRRR